MPSPDRHLPPMDAPKPKPFLIEVMGGERFDVEDSCTIGRSNSADLVLESRRVSRQHAMIKRSGETFLFYDLNSSNGSWVDGREVDQPVPLHDGSQIRIGSFGFTFYTGTGATPEPASTAPDATMVLIDREPMVFLVADIHSFTTLSEGLDEAEVADMLGPWYERCGTIIVEAKGTIDKFIGDSVFAYWRGTDIGVRAAACKCAGAIARSMEGLEGLGGSRCGVAVHIGKAAVGAIAPGSRTALGEAVNMTFRVEGLTRPLGRTALATGAFLEGWDAGKIMFDPCGMHAVSSSPS